MTKKEERQLIFEKHNGHCGYCGIAIELNGFEVDHIHPILRGYRNYDVDTLENKIPACRACNRGKKSYKLEEWRIILQGKLNELNRDSGIYRAAKRFGMVSEKEPIVQFYFERKNT